MRGAVRALSFKAGCDVGTPWSELSELRRRLERVEPVVTEVAVLKTELHNVTRELQRNTKATEQVAEQMERAQIEPLTRGQERRAQLFIALVAALTAGGLGIIATLLAVHG